MLSVNAIFKRHRYTETVIFALALSLILLVSGCGFKLKQSQNLPFNTLYTNVPENSNFGAQLRRILTANSPNLRLVSTTEMAEVQLLQINSGRHLRELSLDPSGDVENYELQLFMEFSLIDNKAQLLMPATTLSVIRDMPNNPDNSYAKQIEIDTLFTDMELSLVDRLVRRLSAVDVVQAYEKSQLINTDPELPAVQAPASATTFQ